MIILRRGGYFVESPGMPEELEEALGIPVDPFELAPFMEYYDPANE